MKKAFDQTVRDIKREVNKKVLKVPGIEQKVLDATSNEPWGPHGSHLADISQATRNYNEYQMIMMVLWKRINDTGRNWRHVYKALTVLEYLVAHGSERVIDEIKEHAYQISTLSDFQYIDSSGRDQGSNVRKKSQSLVSLVNDKERIQEVRQKAFANRDKYRGASSTGGMYRPSSYSSTGGHGDRYDDDRYEGRYGYKDDDRNGYGREKEWGNRDDDRYGRVGDSRNGDRYGRDSDERYSRDGYRDDDYRRNQGNDDYQYGSRSRSSDREKDRSYEDDDRYSSRSGGGRADEQSPDERRLERKLSEPNAGVPPSYEEAVNDVQLTQNERDGGPVAAAPAPKTSSTSGNANQVQVTTVAHVAASVPNKEVDAFDEFDPRASASAAPPAANTAEMDLFGVLSDSVSANSLALIPVTSITTTSEPDAPIDSGFGSTFVPLSSASTVLNQPSEDPFGDGPFKAVSSEDNFSAQSQSFTPTNNLAAQAQNFAPANSLVVQPHNFAPVNNLAAQPQNFAPANSFASQAQNYMSANSFTSQPQNYATTNNFVGQPQNLAPTNTFADQPQNFVPTNTFAAQSQNFVSTSSFHSPAISEGTVTLQPAALKVETVSNFGFGDTFQGITYAPSSVNNVQIPSATPEFAPSELAASQPSSGVLGYLQQQGLAASQAALPTSTALPTKAQPPKDKFETKSTVWTDTLSRGLVNLNISGPKINPLADIGIDFDSINRMEKRKEKSSATPATSTITMGKAMGSGSGISRAGVTAIRPPNSMMGHSMGMGMGGGAALGMGMANVSGMGMGMGMGSYGAGMNQPMGMGMGMGMNMGMGQGVQMRPAAGMPPGPGGMVGGYNPMMGMGGYTPQQPYGGYR